MASIISTTSRPLPYTPVLWVLLSCLCISVMGVLVKLLGHNLSSFQIAFFRAAFALVMILPLILAKGPAIAKSSRPLLLIGRGLAGTIGMTAGFYAIIHMPLADATAIVFTTPLFVILLAGLVLGESIGTHHWIAAAIGFSGVVVLVQPSGGFVVQEAAMMALIGAMAVAAVKLMLRSLAQTEETLTILVYATVVMVVVTAGPAWWTWQWPTAGELIILVLIGLLANLGQYCMITGYRMREASDLAPFEYSRLLFALLFGMLVFSEFPVTATLLGAATIVLSNLYITVAAPKHQDEPNRQGLLGRNPKPLLATGRGFGAGALVPFDHQLSAPRIMRSVAWPRHFSRRKIAGHALGHVIEARHQKLKLVPDRQSKFQKRDRTSSHLHKILVDEIRERLGASRPRVILCCGKCRVGSTALANVFGHAGLCAYYQPIKTLLRHLLVDDPFPSWSLATDRPVIFMKETLGPYVTAECVFNPLEVLLDAGVPKDDIVFLLMEREPTATFSSWRRCWRDRLSDEELLNNFLLASAHSHRLREQAVSHGIAVHDYIHEESRQPEIAIPRLFKSLSLQHQFDPSALRGWMVGNSLQGANLAVQFFRQPGDYRIDDIHSELTEYRLVERKSNPEDFRLTPEEQLGADLPWLQGLYHAAWYRAESERPFCFPDRVKKIAPTSTGAAQQTQAA
ncbi:MAG: DMT family transporter [Geminicoccaceae bacterium]